MDVLADITPLRNYLAPHRGRRRIVLVPTMGALHEGHMSLVRMSRSENHLTVVSLFVNPTQFSAGEDFEGYPRDIEGDIKKLRDAEVDVIFAPEAKAMYPTGFSSSLEPGGLSGRLCGAFRPGHFSGVATVVAKLFNIALPRRSYFGLKDYQQGLVIKRIAADLNMPVEVVLCPTMREEDGLAMSSRNQYLGPEDRRAAPVIYRALTEAAEKLKAGGAPAEAAALMGEMLGTEPRITEVQYAGVYDPESLEELEEFRGRAVLAVAVKMGNARLIDNILI